MITEQQAIEILQNMSEEELTALEETVFPEALQKQAQAQVASQDLASALYGFGQYQADLAIASFEAEGGELSKEASAEFAEAGQELEEAIDELVDAAGINDIEDEAEMHKQASAAAGIIFAGYADQLEKIAAGGKAEKVKAFLNAAKGKAKEMAGKAKYHAKGAIGKMKKHKGTLAAGAAGAAAGYTAAKMQKKASEITADELSDLVLQKLAGEAVFEECMTKSAGIGAKAAEKMKKGLGMAKAHVAKHKNKYMAGGAAAAGAAGGYMAGKKKD